MSKLSDLINTKSQLLTQRRKRVFAFVLIVITSILILPGLVNLKVDAGWFNNDWYYRKKISIASHTSEEINVYVTVPSFNASDTSKFQSDCGDLRFTKLNGELLPYYVVDCDSTADIHVQFDVLPSGASSYYMYYGNPTVTNGFTNSDFSTHATGLGTATLGSEEKGSAPVATWKLDSTSGTIAYDSGSNQLNGTLMNMDPGSDWLAAGSCKLNNCLDFDGSNDYVEVPYDSKLNTPEFSISGWVYLTGGAGTTRSLFTTRYGVLNVEYHGFAIYASNTNFWQVYLGNGSGTWNIFTSNVATTLNTWTHIAVTYDGSNIRLYVNGRLQGTHSAASYSVNNSHPARIGAGATEGPATFFFPGRIDNLNAYSYAIDQNQIYQDMADTSPIGSSTSAALPTPLIHYKFDEQTGQTTNNSISSSYPGTLGADASTSTDDPTWNNPDSCRTNGCMTFDGTTDYTSVGNINNLGTNYSVSAWVKYEGTGGTTVISYRTDTLTHSNNVAFQIDSAGSDFRFVVRNNAGTIATATAPGSLNTNWTHVLGVRNGNLIQIYINGVLSGTANASLGAITMNKLIIGGLYIDSLNQIELSSLFKGNIDEVKIWNTSLTADQAKLDYNAESALNVGVTANTEASTLVGGAGNPPISEWKFDENTGSIAGDTSINSNNLTLNSDTKWVPGKVGSALQFDGVDDNATAPNSAMLNIGTSDFTIEAWVKGRGMENSDVIIGKTTGGGCSTTYGYSLGVSDSLYPTLYFCTTTGSHAKIQGQQSLVDGQWYHIVVVVDRDSTANTKMYINGILATTTLSNLTSHTGSITNTEVLAIGSESNNGFNWDGQIDQIKIYNYLRTTAQIAYSFNRGGPASWWRFDEVSGTVAKDYSTLGNNGTLVNMDGSADWISGDCKVDGCLDFDGINDYVSIPYNPSYEVGKDFSISVWVKTRSLPAGGMDYADFIIEKGHDTQLGTFYISIGPTGNYGITLRRTSTISHSAYSPANFVVLNKWTHLVGTWDGSTVSLYVDGVLISSATSAPVTIPTLDAPIWIGANNNNSFRYQFNGLIDDVRLYNYALSSYQVRQIFNMDSAIRYQ